MDLKQIEKLMAAMERSRIKRVVLKREEFEIEIERECLERVHAASVLPAPPIYSTESLERPSTLQEAKTQPTKGYFITSPMVGTFYSSPSPDDPSFIKEGDQVNEESVVCIIEAMKVMNEVKAGIKGTIAEVLVKNGEPVEFGSNIFRIEP